MSFINVGDILKLGEGALKLWKYGFSEASNAGKINYFLMVYRRLQPKKVVRTIQRIDLAGRVSCLSSRNRNTNSKKHVSSTYLSSIGTVSILEQISKRSESLSR